MKMRLRAWLAAAVVLATLCGTGAMRLTAQDFDSDAISGFAPRAIGPAVLGGRIADMTAVDGKRLTIWIGSAGGGVWRSLDGGTTFKPVFDKYTQSIGSVVVDPSDSKTVWVGTGESWTRNSVSIGTGVYVTHDNGENWTQVGLKDSEHISAIAIHPKDGNTVYTCALGHLWDSNDERGVFKTTDGGKTWAKVFYRDDKTGCADLKMDPKNPDVLYAAMWQVKREPHTFTSGGPGSGLFKTTDGGKTWKELREGMPKGDLGRIGIGIAPSQPSRVYAVVEALNHTALFRSDDSGATWAETNSSSNISGRPFYFARLVVDPSNPDRVYKPGFNNTVSDDGGKTFSTSGIGDDDSQGVHGDFHAVWINPSNTEQLLTVSDGGLYQSMDRGAKWRFLQALPLSQFYHVSYDMQFPYNVYGGLQDNGTWFGPSRHDGGIANRHWNNIGFGDGFWALVDAKDQDVVYVEYQGGHILRHRKSNGEFKDVQPLPRPGEPDFRFNWNAAMHIGPKSGALYIGAQILFRSTNGGESWERISGDLTTNDPERQHQEKSGGLTTDNSDAEKFETIISISESPKDANVIWVGTDDGRLQVTRDGGKSWTDVSTNATGVPAGTWVSTVNAGAFDTGTAFATFDGHAKGDKKTYIYKTSDYGKTWKALATADVTGYAHTVRQDTVNPNLLFAGTEFGLYLSLDGGTHWAQMKGSFPVNVAVRDIVIHPREQDLLIATHGRGIFILDDLTPLRALTPEILASEAAILPARPALLPLPSGEQRMDGDAEFVGRTLSTDSPIVYYQKKRHVFGDLKFEIFDSKGTLLTTITGDKRRGLNRIYWAQRLKAPKVPPAASLIQSQYAFQGPQVPEGTYTVKMTKGKNTYNGEIKLVADPRSTDSVDDRAFSNDTAFKLYNMLAKLTYLVDAGNDLRDQAKARAEKVTGTTKADKALKASLTKLADDMNELRGSILAIKEGGAITGERKLREKLGELYGSVNGYPGRPTQSQLDYMGTLSKQLDDAAAKLQAKGTEAAALSPTLAKSKLDPIKLMAEDDWKARNK